MSRTVIVIAQGLDPNVFREGVRYALEGKVREAARDVRKAARELANVPDERLHDVEQIRIIAVHAGESVCAYRAALEALEMALADHDEALEAFNHPELLLVQGVA